MCAVGEIGMTDPYASLSNSM